MIPGNTARNGNGRQYHSANHNGDSQGTKLARLTARQFGRGPGSPGSWSRFLVAHARWILGVTLAVVAVAAVFVSAQTRLYRSEADVVVELSAAAVNSGGQQPDMSTEESVVTSGVVLSKASRDLRVPVPVLSNGLSVKAQGVSSVLQIMYSSPDRYVAQQRAQAIARAYTSFRSAKPGSGSSAAGSAPVATLITPASLPASPYTPSYPLDLGVALLIGLVLAIATAWGRDHLDDRLRGPLDLERQADADVLGMIPAFSPAGRKPRAQLAMAVSPGSIVAEAYRGLRTRVLLAAAGRNSETILVTSPAWEDRGTVAGNLAAALAQSGRSTVLVCADLHWSRAHLLFGIPGDAQGLTELLEQRTETADALHATGVPGLRLLPPGAPPQDSAALLQLPALRTALNGIRAQADIMVIEAPPLLVSPDARPLADCAGMMLLVADARASTRAQVRAAVRELGQERARLAGCVLINVGTHQRLRPDNLPSAHAPDDRSSRAQAIGGNVIVRSMPDTALSVPGNEIEEERQWPNGS